MEKRIRSKDEPKNYLNFRTLPKEYLKMVDDVFAKNFADGLKVLGEYLKKPRFHTSGKIYQDELQLCVSILSEGELAATSVHASCDYDSKANLPTVNDRLADCVDAAGIIWANLLDTDKPEAIEELSARSLTAMENVPFEWTKVEVNKRKIFVCVDKTNPAIDELTNDWLKKNDPHYKDPTDAEAEAVQSLADALRDSDSTTTPKKIH
ncbi:MAG: hypothetical protein KA715_06090 [Xanthomonadaceae bacterium]|nr:hypothetical protein [Xanthomonadaceae bacterium]